MISNSSFEKIRKKADEVRNIKFSALLQYFGSTKDHQDKAKWHTSQGVISVNSPEFMNCTRRTGGGGAIDLVIHLQGLVLKMPYYDFITTSHLLLYKVLLQINHIL